MSGNNQSRMVCVEFEALLGDALDQTLTGTQLADFQSHAAQCAMCGPLLHGAEAGQHWLKALAAAEPPVYLVHNILAATSGAQSRRAENSSPSSLWGRFLASVFAPIWKAARQPRFAMSFGMAFFSLSICMSVAGVSVDDLRHLDLRPSALKRNYYATSGRMVKYYENIRFVYEIESRMREFKRLTAPAEPVHEEKNMQEEKNKERKNDQSGQPELRQDRDYSQGENQPLLAKLPPGPRVVVATPHRRLL